MNGRFRAFFAILSLRVNRATGGPEGQFLCARLAERFGAHSWPCRLLDLMSCEPGHCRRQLFDWRYGASPARIERPNPPKGTNMFGSLAKGQIRTWLAFAGGILIAIGDWSITDITSLVTDIETMAGIISALVAAVWSAKDKMGAPAE
jgi:hypothetical protein